LAKEHIVVLPEIEKDEELVAFASILTQAALFALGHERACVYALSEAPANPERSPFACRSACKAKAGRAYNRSSIRMTGK